jgi:hypothetical protein
VFRSCCSLSCVSFGIRPLIRASLILTSSVSVLPKSAVYNTYGGTQIFSSSLSPFQAVAMVTFCILFYNLLCPSHAARCICVSLTLSLHTWHSVIVYTSGLLLLSSSRVGSLSITHFINALLLVLILLVVQCIPFVIFSLFQKNVQS